MRGLRIGVTAPARARTPAAVVVAAWGAWVVAAAAQNAVPAPLSAFSGSVVDITHAAVPDIAVTLEDVERRVTHRVVADGLGRFAVADLPPGNYVVEAVLPGFTPFHEQITIAGSLVEQQILLDPEAISETLTVSAGDTVLNPAGDTRARGPAEPCAVPVDPDTQSPVGGQLRPPRMLTHQRPRFPDHLRNALVDGSVQIAGRIGTDGRMSDLQIRDGAHPDFADAAEDAVRQWTWEEALLNCEPVAIGVSITISFVLPGQSP